MTASKIKVHRNEAKVPISRGGQKANSFAWHLAPIYMHLTLNLYASLPHWQHGWELKSAHSNHWQLLMFDNDRERWIANGESKNRNTARAPCSIWTLSILSLQHLNTGATIWWWKTCQKTSLTHHTHAHAHTNASLMECGRNTLNPSHFSCSIFTVKTCTRMFKSITEQ